MTTIDGPVRLPVDDTLGVLATWRARPADALRHLGVDEPVHRYDVLKHHPGKRCTLLAHTDSARFVVKIFRARSERVAGVLLAMADAGLDGVRVPAIVGWDPDRHVVVTDCYDGPSLDTVLALGGGARVGHLAAAWTLAVVDADVSIGRLLTPAVALADMVKFAQDAVDYGTRRRWVALAEALAADLPNLDRVVPVHGSTKLDHLYDCAAGAGPVVGLVDWDGYHRGAPEFDVATTLANVDAAEVTGEQCAVACGLARDTLLAGVEQVVDGDTLAWYRALALGKIVGKLARRRDPASWAAAELLAARAGEHLRRRATTRA